MDSPPPGKTDSPPRYTKMQCQAIKTNGQRCARHAIADDTLCRLHRTITNRNTMLRNETEVWNQLLDRMWGDRIDTIEPLQEIIRQAHVDGRINDLTALLLTEDLAEEWLIYQQWRPRPQVQPKSDLHALALDNQNVHTTAVSSQTNETLALLLSTPVPASDVIPLVEIMWGWCDKPYTPSDRNAWRAVLRDMRKWYEQPSCRETNDWLYKRALDGLWTRIKASPAKDELYKRLCEEACESVKMCCEGHITRLCNVLVGFDDEVKPPVPVGEILQQKMAVIAEKDIPVEHKVGEAWAVFEELKIPMEQREAWIDAF